eukprot:gnl/TRDRNA2_/TRDRNA2_35325_c0_seq1.p1 gnl/TRDRNA2_/TRDRNA2_35325_c0~~gnl/TRDRNA2_/TRDRNA2_35325_c0_seq1.p1  ORF type:complete len:545 (+),score=119.45 gnl/TRDRNA2_/TRDRNA2_35325_c0_seq1:227-1636(+)
MQALGAEGGEVWSPCALEGEFVDGPAELVRFGWGLAWVEKQVEAGAQCSSAVFGRDPAPGVRKVCECAGASGGRRGRRDELGIQWSHCGVQDETCTCPSGTVRFGLGSRWLVHQADKPAMSSLACDAKNFEDGDPAYELPKECWCEVARKPEPKTGNKVAIVLDSRRPPDLKTWLQYHMVYMGVDHVFMQVEDTPDFNISSIAPALQKRITIWKAEAVKAGDKRPADDYTTLQARQMKVMQRAKDECTKMGIDWLFHIDDDELIYTPLHRKIGDVMANLPQEFDQAFIPNVEALFKSADVKGCFTETTDVNVNPFAYVSYANGKSAVRVANPDAIPAGPHQWKADWGGELPSVHMDKEAFGPPLFLIHYESCPFSRWEDKYIELGNTSPDKVAKIPFQFYRESITRMMQCTGKKNMKGVDANMAASWKCSQAGLKNLWTSWKTKANKHISPEDVMPIQIPWKKVMAMHP